MRHIVSAADLSVEELALLFERARKLERTPRGSYLPTLGGALVALCFYEPSTRTFLSFSSAVKRLGGSTIETADAKAFSSAVKGETLEDSIRVISDYADLIVLRHPESGAAARAAGISLVPVVNAGDGGNEHPTQAFLDLYTIWNAVQEGRLPDNGLRFLFWGDNRHSRTVRSLVKLLASHGEALGIPVREVIFTGPPGFAGMSENIEGIRSITITDYRPTLDADVVYITRPQKERHPQGLEPEKWGFTARMVEELPPHAIVMHPLPRNDELPTEVDEDERAWYFKQAHSGLFVRMALLEYLLND